MPSSRHSVGTYQGNKITPNSSGYTHVQSSQLAEPLWTDPDLKKKRDKKKEKRKKNWCVWADFQFLKKVQAENESWNLPPNSSREEKSHHHHHHPRHHALIYRISVNNGTPTGQKQKVWIHLNGLDALSKSTTDKLIDCCTLISKVILQWSSHWEVHTGSRRIYFFVLICSGFSFFSLYSITFRPNKKQTKKSQAKAQLFNIWVCWNTPLNIPCVKFIL